MESHSIPAWKLPPGVSRGCWDYAHSKQIAENYDESFASDALFEYDQKILAEQFIQPGSLIDLGCGTGRHVLEFAKRGFDVMGVDLSPEMLERTRCKAEAANVQVTTQQANLVELSSEVEQQFDYAICMFSTLGMIQGGDHRLQALYEVNRVLKPGGKFAVHVHNLWSVLKTGSGRNWLAGHAVRAFCGQEQLGDSFAAYRGISQFYLHFFTATELRNLLTRAGFQIQLWHPFRLNRNRNVETVSYCQTLRADGWIVIAEKTADQKFSSRLE